jgi:PilZ domain
MDALMKFIHSGRGYAVGNVSARRTPRYSLAVDAEVTDLELKILVKARTKMLSLHGCGVESLNLFPKGTTVKIKLSHRGTEVKALARIVYASSDLGTGVTFTDIQPEGERVLEQWIAELVSLPIR